MPDRTTTNLANLAAALKDLDARIRAAGIDGVPFSASAESLDGVSILDLTTRFGDLDLAFSPAAFSAGFQRLQEGATSMTIDGLTVLVASLDDVIASKEAAGRDKTSRRGPGSSSFVSSKTLTAAADEQSSARPLRSHGE